MTEYVEVDEGGSAGPNGEDAGPADNQLEDFAHAVLRLSGMEHHEYDRVRKEEAVKLGVRVATLDAAVERIWRSAEAETRPGSGQDLKLPEPEPWPEPIERRRST